MEKTFFISGIGGQGVQVLCKALATVVDLSLIHISETTRH